MNIQVKTTEDGSQTLYSEQFGESYHSVHGAVMESTHVFLEAGFRQCRKSALRVFEVGFGTGLNAFLTYIEAQKQHVRVQYDAIELYPLPAKIVDALSYADYLSADNSVFVRMHEIPWNSRVEVSSFFRMKKIKEDLRLADPENLIDVVYFDAFSPESQPELWTKEIFEMLYDRMSEGGILTTYCAKGIVRRTLEETGFRMERLPGPPGKREMLRGRKY